MPKCPICGGTGKYDFQYGKVGEGLYHTIDCYGCEGEGKVKKIWEGPHDCPYYAYGHEEIRDVAECVIWVTLSGKEQYTKK